MPRFAPRPAAALAAALLLAPAARADSVYAWGNNTDGQLGDGTRTNSSTPVAAAGPADFVLVDGGFLHTLAVRADGTVRSWGDNLYGQLGNGATTDASAPVAVSGLTAATAVAAGDYHGLAVRADGTVRAWGTTTPASSGTGPPPSGTPRSR